jgi:protein-tyrosine kinase
MSRIEEALRLTERSVVNQGDEGGSGQEPFRSPWEFRANGSPADRQAETQLPAEPLPTGGAVVAGFTSKWKQRLVVSPDAEPFLVEQFRRLAATLHQAQSSRHLKTVMLTSAVPGDGKTLTSINLALTLSESYRRRVLLIDADLRRPSIRDVTQMNGVIGLTEGLRAQTEQKLTVLKLTPNLFLLPAGRPDPDPMAGLTSNRMRRIVADAASHYDWVIVDAPPVGPVSDASILAEMMDGTLFVVRAGYTQGSIAQRAVEVVGKERILGVVLNAVEDGDRNEYVNYSYHTDTAISDETAIAAPRRLD